MEIWMFVGRSLMYCKLSLDSDLLIKLINSEHMDIHDI